MHGGVDNRQMLTGLVICYGHVSFFVYGLPVECGCVGIHDRHREDGTPYVIGTNAVLGFDDIRRHDQKKSLALLREAKACQ